MKLLVNRGKGTEGWIPLWAKAATSKQAAKVVENMLDENKFNKFVPFPTASKDNDKYDLSRYWRGPVWLDQALYAVEVLQNYGYNEEAKDVAYKLFDHAKGLLDDGPIHENNNPEMGEGQHTKNFSWSASAFYLLYQNTLTSTNTTSQTGFEIPGAEVKVNKGLLFEAIKKAEVVDSAKYTKESYQKLATALENGRKVYDEEATHEQVDQAVNSINEALATLKEITVNENTSPNTGDNLNVLLSMTLMVIAGGAILFQTKKEVI